MKLRIFTDGACSGNPGPGGWAAVFNFMCGNRILSGYEENTTNNRMELISVLHALNKIERMIWNDSYSVYSDFVIYSDSLYVINAINNGWVRKWKKNGWIKDNGEAVKNKELWSMLVVIIDSINYSIGHEILSFEWIKGHDGNTFNALADNAARAEIIKNKVVLK